MLVHTLAPSLGLGLGRAGLGLGCAIEDIELLQGGAKNYF